MGECGENLATSFSCQYVVTVVAYNVEQDMCLRMAITIIVMVYRCGQLV